MDDPFARLWWLLAARGVTGILFGILAVVWPLFTLEALLAVFAVYAIADGVVAFAAGASRNARGYPWWPLAVEGFLGIAMGTLVLAFPDAVALLFGYLVAGRALVTGAIEIFAAIRLRQESEGSTLLAGAGIASVVLGGLMLGWPRAAVITLAWLIGLYAALFGLLLLVLALRLRRVVQNADDRLHHVSPRAGSGLAS